MTPRTLAFLGFLGSLGTAGVWGLVIHLRERHWRLAPGKVVGITSRLDVDGIEVYAPTFEFRDPEGRLRSVLHRVFGSEKAFRVGQEVMLAFDPSDPEGAHLHSLWTKYQPCWIALFIALCCVMAYMAPEV